MSCQRCPYHVRHGRVGADGKSIEFSDLCGLKIKAQEREESAKEKHEPKKAGAKAVFREKPKYYGKEFECINMPFEKSFQYRLCDVYLQTFKTPGMKNDVIPTKDFQYSDAFAGNSITDMELL